MLTTIGKQRIASKLASGSLMTHLAVGDDDTEENIADLSLGNELYRVALDTIAQSDQTCWGVGTILASDIGAGSYDIIELGLYDSASGGNLICRVVLSQAVTITGAQRLIAVLGVVNP